MASMANSVDDLLSRMLEDVFDEPDFVKRAGAIAALFTEDCVFSDPRGRHIGHSELQKAVAEIRAALPGFRFTAKLRQSLTDAGRQHWGFGLAGESQPVSGLDIIIVADGKIGALYTFLDPKVTP
jgi:hypothetical protein